MKAHDLMRDPFYAQIIYRVEAAIHAADKAAMAAGISFTDGQIKSVLDKSSAIAKGKRPKIDAKRKRSGGSPSWSKGSRSLD